MAGTAEFYAHSSNGSGERHDLVTHLRSVFGVPPDSSLYRQVRAQRVNQKFIADLAIN